jgi:hypothetical protein
VEEMLPLLEGNIFGCGNVKGLPLELLAYLDTKDLERKSS